MAPLIKDMEDLLSEGIAINYYEGLLVFEKGEFLKSSV